MIIKILDKLSLPVKIPCLLFGILSYVYFVGVLV